MSIVFRDTFTGVNGTKLDLHTPDVVRYGGNWVDPSDWYEIYDNVLRFVGSSTSYYDPYIDLGTNSVAGTLTYRAMVGVANVDWSTTAIQLRKQDSAHFLEAYICYLSPKFFVVLWYKNGGSAANLATIYVSGFNPFVMFPFKIIDTGSQIKIYADPSGTEATTMRLNYSTTLFNDRHLMGPHIHAHAGTWPRIDNLQVDGPGLDLVRMVGSSVRVGDGLAKVHRLILPERDTPKVFQVKWPPRVFGVDERRR